MKPLLRDYLVSIGLYLLLVVGGAVFILTLSSAIGYLPYSDRPGPGWYGSSISFSQVGYYLAWGMLLLPLCFLWGTVVFTLLRFLRFLGAPRLLIQALGGLIGGVLTLLLVAGTGWYIAIAAFPVWVTGALGVVWGSVLLPRYLGPSIESPPGPARWAAIALLAVGAPGALYWTFFVPGYSQELVVTLVRVTPSENELITDNWRTSLKPDELALLTSLFPHGDLHSGLGGSSGTGPARSNARMLIVVTKELSDEVKLRVPIGVSVAYVQRGDRWIMYPANAPTLGQTIRLGPGSSVGEATFAWPHGKATTFTWYPAIK